MRLVTGMIIVLFAAFPRMAAAQQQQQQQSESAFGDGEKLTYVVSYRAALVPNLKVAEVRFVTTRENLDGLPVYHVWANGKVFSGFKWFFDLNDTYETWLDAGTFKPVRFSARLREGDYKYDMNYVYSWPRMEVYTAYRNLKRPTTNYKTMQLSDNSFDPIAMFFNLRNTDMSGFREGESRNIRLVLEDTIRPLRYTFIGSENRKIGDLGEYRTLKFSCELVSSTGESFKDGSVFYIWISDDKNKIPLHLESPIRVGTIKVTATAYENLKHPVDSRIK